MQKLHRISFFFFLPFYLPNLSASLSRHADEIGGQPKSICARFGRSAGAITSNSRARLPLVKLAIHEFIYIQGVSCVRRYHPYCVQHSPPSQTRVFFFFYIIYKRIYFALAFLFAHWWLSFAHRRHSTGSFSLRPFHWQGIRVSSLQVFHGLRIDASTELFSDHRYRQSYTTREWALQKAQAYISVSTSLSACT